MNEREVFDMLLEKHPAWMENIKLKGRVDERSRMLAPYDVESIEELIQNVRAKAIEESIEQIKCFNPNTTEEAKGLQEAINIMLRLKGDKELCK